MRGERHIKALDFPFQYQFKQHPVLNVSQITIPSSQKSLRNQAHSIPCENMCSPHSYHPCHSGSARSSSRHRSPPILQFSCTAHTRWSEWSPIICAHRNRRYQVAIRVYLPTIYIHLTSRNCSSRHFAISFQHTS